MAQFDGTKWNSYGNMKNFLIVLLASISLVARATTAVTLDGSNNVLNSNVIFNNTTLTINSGQTVNGTFWGTGVVPALRLAIGSPNSFSTLDSTGNFSASSFGLEVGPQSSRFINFIGDSITWGASSGASYSFPNLLANGGFGDTMTVYNFGIIGVTTQYFAPSGTNAYGTNNLYSSLPSPGASTSAHSVNAANATAINLIQIGTNDASQICGVLNDVATTCTTTSGSPTFTVATTTSGSYSAQNGAYVVCANFPLGTAYTFSGTTCTASANATASGSGVAVVLGTETLAQWQSAYTSLLNAISSDCGTNVNIWPLKLLPRNVSTDNALVNPTLAAQNAWIASQAGTLYPAGHFIDITAQMTNPNNTNIYSTAPPAGLHPTPLGNRIIYSTISSNLLAAYGSNYSYYPWTLNGILSKYLPSDVAYTDVAQTWTAQQVWNKSTSSPSIVVNSGASVTGPDIQLNGVSGTSSPIQSFALGGVDQWTIGTGGLVNVSSFNIKDLIGGLTPLSIAEGTGVVTVNGLVSGTITSSGGGNGSISLNGSTQVIALNNQGGGGTSITGSSGGTLHWTINFDNATMRLTDGVNSVNQLTVNPGSGTTGSVAVAGTLTSNALTTGATSVTTLAANGNTTLTSNVLKQTFTGAAPLFLQNLTGNATDQKNIAWTTDTSGNCIFEAVNDAVNSGNNWMKLVRGSGFTISGTQIFGYVAADTLGSGFQTKEGSNAKQGTATLVSGTVTVNNTSVTANSRIFLSRSSANGSSAIGSLTVGTVTAGTSFVITSLASNALTATGDTSIVNYEIFEPAP